MTSDTASHTRYLKTMYFLYFIALGSASPFSSLFLKRIIVDADGKPVIALIGLLYSILPFIALVANLTAAIIADRLHLGRRIIAFNSLASVVLTILLAQAAQPWTHGWGLNQIFWYIFIFMALNGFSTGPISPMLDSETLHHLSDNGGRARYGTIRLWGTFGWSVSTISIGFLMSQTNSLATIYYGAAIGYLFLGIVAFRSVSGTPIKPPITISWRHLIGNHRFQMFLVLVFIYGTAYNAAATYFAYFFDDVMKSFWQMGLIFGTWTLFEIPVMIWSRRLIQRLGSGRLILLGLLFNVARLFLFSCFTVQTPFLLKFATALLHGPAYAFFQIGSIDFIDRHAHEKLRATYLSSVVIVQNTLGMVSGALLGSWIIGGWNSKTLFATCGWIMTLTLIGVVVANRYLPGRKAYIKKNK